MLVSVTYMIWDLTCYFGLWLFSHRFGEFGLLLLLIRLSWTILKYALYYFQITFSSFELVICHSRYLKLCVLLDFKCYLPRNLMEKLISFGIMWKFSHYSVESQTAGIILLVLCQWCHKMAFAFAWRASVTSFVD